MLGKLLASLIYLAVVLLLFMMTYILVGMLAYAMTGVPYSYTFGKFSDPGFGTLLGNTLLIGLITLGFWFSFAMIAFFFGTLGRATAAAIGAGLGWYFLEGIVTLACNIIRQIVPTGLVHDLTTNLPAYLLSSNFGALIANRVQARAGQSSTGSISDLHALLVVGVYLVLLIGGSLLLTWRRDVTN
jgi:hypothetical protein